MWRNIHFFAANAPTRLSLEAKASFHPAPRCQIWHYRRDVFWKFRRNFGITAPVGCVRPRFFCDVREKFQLNSLNLRHRVLAAVSSHDAAPGNTTQGLFLLFFFFVKSKTPEQKKKDESGAFARVTPHFRHAFEMHMRLFAPSVRGRAKTDEMLINALERTCVVLPHCYLFIYFLGGGRLFAICAPP